MVPLSAWRVNKPASTGLVAALLCVALYAAPSPAFAQRIGDQMCGDGTTFTVPLPGTSLGIDDSTGLWRNIEVPAAGPADSVTLPNGCRIYAILVSGFSQNPDRDAMIFYKVAEFVARNGGYVHVSWWNNLLKEYMGGPLHPVTVRIQRLFGLLDDLTIPPSPGDGFSAFAPAGLDLPKANPDEDFQFQSDAARVIRAIRAHNPDAIIVVAGHSMGGGAVARLGMTRDLEIDLLAPIDPVNNRDQPQGQPGTRNFNWNRWRANHSFAGYKQYDCVRNAAGLCRDFDSRLFYTQYRCEAVGNFLNAPPLFPSRAPLVCPRTAPYVDPGTLLGFGSNIKHLYHRWQFENVFPFDFLRTERFLMHGPLTNDVLGPNHQRAVEASVLGVDPNRTCIAGPDPRDSSYNCDATDGHGEIVGYRGTAGELRPGLELANWPPQVGRREALLELPQQGSSWNHRPVNPDLCMVCDDMITIVQHLLDQQPAPPSDTTAPTTLIAATPGVDDGGWNNESVTIDLTAQDEPNGSGVLEIVTTLTGAQTGGDTTAGGAAQEIIAAEGLTTVTYLARDHAGNAGDPETLEVRVDRTPPEIAAVTSLPASVDGWHNTSVTVSFTASDALSGVVAISDPIVVAGEGADQEIVGTATDVAENHSTATATVSIDRTPPSIAAHLSAAPNASGWHRGDVLVSFTATDGLSGVRSVSAPVLVTAEGVDQLVSGIATDRAGNTATTTVRINIDKTAPHASIQFDPATNDIAVNGLDSLSGVPATHSIAESIVAGTQPKLGYVAVTELHRIEDAAGNSLVMIVDVWRKVGDTRAIIRSVDYGSGMAAAPRNALTFGWWAQEGALKNLEQYINADEQTRTSKLDSVARHVASASFSAKRGVTYIQTLSPEPRSEVRPGLTLIRLVSERGKLRVEIP